MFRKYSPYKGFVHNRFVKQISIWWPMLTLVTFATFFVFDERRYLGWSRTVWQGNRLIIIVASIGCLIFLYNAKWRDLLGLTMLWYGATTATSYWFSVPHDNAFWGELIRIIVFSILIWLLTVQSALTLRQQEIEKVIVMSEEDLDRFK